MTNVHTRQARIKVQQKVLSRVSLRLNMNIFSNSATTVQTLKIYVQFQC